jgi:hypothetical protein
MSIYGRQSKQEKNENVSTGGKKETGCKTDQAIKEKC